MLNRLNKTDSRMPQIDANSLQMRHDAHPSWHQMNAFSWARGNSLRNLYLYFRYGKLNVNQLPVSLHTTVVEVCYGLIVSVLNCELRGLGSNLTMAKVHVQHLQCNQIRRLK